MSNPEVCIIAAIAENRVIGKDGQLPWHISEDMKRFRELTFGHPVIMGRKTFESIGKALVGRDNLVVSQDKTFAPEGCITCDSLEIAIDAAKGLDDERFFVVGGGQIYDQAIDQADRLYLTVVEGEFEGDTFFPDYSDFQHVVSEKTGESGDLKYRFLELRRTQQ